MSAAPATPYRFTPDELRVLQECNRESFYQRCLPLSTLFGVGAFIAVKSGTLQGNGKFGAVPKVIGAAVLGYFVGKLSYQSKCAEKMMKIPDSKIGSILRNRKHGTQKDVLVMEDQDLEKTVRSIPESEKYSDISNQSPLDMDLDRPLISGLEDYRSSSLDDTRLGDDSFLNSSSRTTSYDELRTRNREEFEQKRTKAYRGVVTPEEVPSGLRSEDRSPLETNRASRPSNVYGDLWEK